MAVKMEGPLSKWTNVVKGWQYRWFVLDDNTGLLSYYTVNIFTFPPFAQILVSEALQIDLRLGPFLRPPYSFFFMLRYYLCLAMGCCGGYLRLGKGY